MTDGKIAVILDDETREGYGRDAEKMGMSLPDFLSWLLVESRKLNRQAEEIRNGGVQ